MEGTAFFFGMAVAWIIAGIIILIFIPTPEDTWNNKYCQYLGGQTQGEVCIVNDKVVDIPDYPRSK